MSSSLPSLESIPSAAEYDSDCEITGYKQPKKKRVVPKPEPVDPEMGELEARCSKFKIVMVKVLHVEILQEMPQDFESEH